MLVLFYFVLCLFVLFYLVLCLCMFVLFYFVFLFRSVLVLKVFSCGCSFSVVVVRFCFVCGWF